MPPPHARRVTGVAIMAGVPATILWPAPAPPRAMRCVLAAMMPAAARVAPADRAAKAVTVAGPMPVPVAPVDAMRADAVPLPVVVAAAATPVRPSVSGR